MEDGLIGLLQETVPNPVVEEVNHLQDHVQTQHPNMVEMYVLDNQQRQKIVTHINALFMVDGQIGLNQEVVPKNVELEAKNM